MHDYSIILHAATDADGVAPFSEAFEQALSDATLNHSLLTTPSTCLLYTYDAADE